VKISKNSVVSIDYTLRDGAGEVLDQSQAGDPLVYLHGYEQIVPGLEAALSGKASGERVVAVIEPAQAYGEKSGVAAVKVPRTGLPPGMEVEVGMALDAQNAEGDDLTLWITRVDASDVYVTEDHPLAGITLHFDVTIREVREATKDELSHGHAHGPGGHH
jgi:FKBP-type peptidyl-prolyl cis-trans isomerase SlyD